jgi:hypothetical protein
MRQRNAAGRDHRRHPIHGAGDHGLSVRPVSAQIEGLGNPTSEHLARWIYRGR